MVSSLLLNIPVIVSAISSTVHAARLPLQGRPSRRLDLGAPASSSVSVATFENLNYFVNLTVGGQVYPTLIDTGSGDLWIYANVSNVTPTGVLDELQYAIGAVEGYIFQAPLSFAGYSIPAQAFVEVQNITNLGSNPRDDGYTAVLGLGPAPYGSTIYRLLGNSTSGLPMMQNIFMQNATSDNYITLLLPRAFDPVSPTFGEMTISELIPGKEAIANQTKLPLTFLNATSPGFHWNTATDLDGIIGPDGMPITIKSETTLPLPVTGNGRLVGVFDSGYTLAQVPATLAEAIYSGVKGAHLVSTGSQDLWEVPCDTEVNVTFVFAGQKIFVHPLDMVKSGAPGPINATSHCIGTFQPRGANTASPAFDLIFGIPFLLNAYILLDSDGLTAGASTSQQTPFIQLLSTTNPIEAHNDFVNVRTNAGVLKA
ncbi:hypothetical protein FRB97_007777 [Tulasnella sp. 331]|nr:hypothetical protein FRB97_007777 [Tulasnella sp. 331]